MSDQLLCDLVLAKCNATQTISDICVTFVVIASIIANAQRDAANICKCKVLVFTGISLSNVKLMLVLYASFSVCSRIFLCCCGSQAIPAVV